MVWAVENGKGRWVNCDEDGNFYKSYHQEYHFTTARHFDCADGFVFSWDGIVVDALADNEAQTAKTIVTNPWEKEPEITHSALLIPMRQKKILQPLSLSRKIWLWFTSKRMTALKLR